MKQIRVVMSEVKCAPVVECLDEAGPPGAQMLMVHLVITARERTKWAGGRQRALWL